MEKGGQVYPIESINMDIRYIWKLLLVTIVTYKFFPYCFPFNYSYVSILGKVWKVTVVLNLMISLYINPNQKGVGGIMPPYSYMLYLDFTCYHGNHFVESTLTKIIKITKLCNF